MLKYTLNLCTLPICSKSFDVILRADNSLFERCEEERVGGERWGAEGLDDAVDAEAEIVELCGCKL